MIAEWRGGNLATMRSINCRSDSASICSRGSISISGTGVGGLARGWDLAEEPEPADFFLDSAMLLKVNSIESFATGTRNKFFRNAARGDQPGRFRVTEIRIFMERVRDDRTILRFRTGPQA